LLLFFSSNRKQHITSKMQAQDLNQIHQNYKKDNINVLLHDLFNVIVLSIISLLNTTYLLLVITNIYDIIEINLFPIVLYSFIGYIIIDSLLIYHYPCCVVSKPRDLLLHHGITLIICLSPMIEKYFEWHAGLALTVEIQTIVLTLRRIIIDKTLILYTVIDTMFYMLFIVFRLFIFPMLSVYYYIEHQKYSVKCNTQINIAITSVTGFFIITLMGFMWIYKFLRKNISSTSTKGQIYTMINNNIPFCSLEKNI
jgi:hypothetical protein